MKEKNAVIEKQSDICEEKLDVVTIFPYARHLLLTIIFKMFRWADCS